MLKQGFPWAIYTWWDLSPHMGGVQLQEDKALLGGGGGGGGARERTHRPYGGGT